MKLVHHIAALTVIATACGSQPGRGSQAERDSQRPAAPPERPSAAIDGVDDVKVGNPGMGHAGCILRKSGQVACWAGPNTAHYFQRGRKDPLPGPWPVDGLDDAVSLWAIRHGHCAVRRDGTGLCWKGKARRALEVDELVSVSGDGNYLCALRRDGSVQCAGTNYNGEIGRPPLRTVKRGRVPVNVSGGVREGDWAPVPGVRDAVALHKTCAITTTGKLICWGAHPLVVQHDGMNLQQHLEALKPQPVRGIPPVSAVAVGHEYACILTTSGTAQCAQRDETNQPIRWRVLDIADVAQIEPGLGGLVMRTEKGDVHLWGPGPQPAGEDAGPWLERKNRAFASGKVRPIASGAAKLSATLNHLCFVTKDAHVMCWGNNEIGQLGDGSLDPKGLTYLVDHQPASLAGPGENAFGCRASEEIARTCPTMGQSCALEPPPGYWRWGPGGGARCTQQCMKKAMDEVRSRPIPGCMCTCSDEYRRLEAVQEQRRMRPPPP